MKKVNLVASMPYHGQYEDADYIGVDKGASYLIQRNKSMVAVIGDFDSISSEDLMHVRRLPLRIEKLNVIKDETDLEAAIKLALSLEYEIINVYGALGGRIDHSLTNINMLKKYPMIRLYDDFSIAFIFKAGKHILNDKTYKFFSMYAIEECEVTLSNFKYPIENYKLSLNDTMCISNELTNSSIVICSNDIIVILSK